MRQKNGFLEKRINVGKDTGLERCDWSDYLRFKLLVDGINDFCTSSTRRAQNILKVVRITWDVFLIQNLFRGKIPMNECLFFMVGTL